MSIHEKRSPEQMTLEFNNLVSLAGFVNRRKLVDSWNLVHEKQIIFQSVYSAATGRNMKLRNELISFLKERIANKNDHFQEMGSDGYTS